MAAARDQTGVCPPLRTQTAPGEVPTEHATGINTFTYFVCNTLGGPFTRLPDITPKQIKAARQLKKLMTGEMPALLPRHQQASSSETLPEAWKIPSLLPNRELRGPTPSQATLRHPCPPTRPSPARRPSSCAPRSPVSLTRRCSRPPGCSTTTRRRRRSPRCEDLREPTPVLRGDLPGRELGHLGGLWLSRPHAARGIRGPTPQAEEFEPKPAEELVSPESWVHRLPHIKLQGRCVVWKPEAEVRLPLAPLPLASAAPFLSPLLCVWSTDKAVSSTIASSRSRHIQHACCLPVQCRMRRRRRSRRRRRQRRAPSPSRRSRRTTPSWAGPRGRQVRGLG